MEVPATCSCFAAMRKGLSSFVLKTRATAARLERGAAVAGAQSRGKRRRRRRRKGGRRAATAERPADRPGRERRTVAAEQVEVIRQLLGRRVRAAVEPRAHRGEVHRVRDDGPVRRLHLLVHWVREHAQGVQTLQLVERVLESPKEGRDLCASKGRVGGVLSMRRQEHVR